MLVENRRFVDPTPLLFVCMI